MDLTRIPGLKGMPAVPPPHGITETAKSPLPSSTSPSSPSSSPASPPSSSSSSPGAVATSYHNDIQEGRANSVMMGDVVSSTSASLAPPSSHSDPPFSSSDPLLCLSPPLVGTDGQKEGETEIYDPFHPTEGEREGGAAEEEEEEEGEKYDPFDPTGSPPSEREEEERATGGGRERGNSVSSKGSDARGKKRKAETGRTGGEEKDNAPPDSTDTLSVLPLSPRSLPLPLRRRLDRTKEPRVKVRDRREKADHSDHSEIEEGEIVGATERDGGNREERGREGIVPLVLPISSGSPFLHGGAKPERILRVLDGDSFVSVRAEGDWAGPVMPGREDGEPMEEEEEEEEEEEVVVVGVGDLRRKLVSRRKARYRSSFPSSLSPQHLPPSPHTVPLPPSPLTAEKDKSHKSSKSSKERERRKRKECKVGEEEERRRRKKRKEKDGGGENGGERKERHRERGRRSEKEKKTKVEEERGRNSRSDSRKRKKRRRSTPESSARPRSQNTSVQQAHGGRSWSNNSEDRHRERDRDRENNRDRYRDRDGERDGDRDKDRKKDDTRRRERDGHSSRIKREREQDGVRKLTSRERGSSKRSKGSIEPRHRERDRHQERERHRERDRERRRDGRPVVPPSIQDLNGSDLFAIKRTITVTTTTTTTLPGSPPLAPSSPRSPSQGSEKPHKRKKKSRRRSEEKLEDSIGRRGSLSLSPPSHYHGYDSDHFSDKLEIDMHSLDGEALDSDYPSIEDSPPQLLEPAALSAKSKTATKPGRHHFKKKSRTGKKAGQSKSSSSVRPKGKGLSTPSLSPTQATPGLASTPTTLPSAKRGRKMGKEKERGEKGGKKESGRSGRSKKLSGGGRKAKLQSKVSVLVREGVSSTTGGSVGSGKLGMELLGVGGPVGGSGVPVVGGSIAVVFRRDNESRSPFLKPCSEPLLLSGRNKDLGKVGKRRSLAVPPSSLLANPTVAALKSKKAKPSSTTSSSASSPSLSLATKRRRRLAKKTRGEKGLASGLTDVGGAMANCSSEGGGWGGSSSDIQSGVGAKPSSPHSGPAGPTPSSSSSSSSSTSVLPPSSSPPHTPPPSLTASRDARESSPDSQTVDSSCKTPEPSFLPEDCPAQTQSTLNLSPSSPSSLPSSQGGGPSQYGPSNMKSLPLDEGLKSLASPPCSSSSGSALALLSLPPSSTDPSSSSSSSVSSSSANKLPLLPPPPSASPTLPWSLQTGVDCTAGGVLALTALLFKMEEANIASRAKAQEFIHATSQILSQTNQNHSSQHAPSSSSSSQVPPSPGPTPAQFILHSALPLVGCTKTPPSHLHLGMSLGGGCAQTPPPPMPSGFLGGSGDSSDIGWDNESKDPDKYLKKLHTQERAVEEVKLAIKPYYQRKDINKDDYKDILRKAVHKICHSRKGEINPVKVSNLVKLYVQRYKYFRKHGRKMDEEVREDREMDSSY